MKYGRLTSATPTDVPGVWLAKLDCGHSVRARGPLIVGMHVVCGPCSLQALEDERTEVVVKVGRWKGDDYAHTPEPWNKPGLLYPRAPKPKP